MASLQKMLAGAALSVLIATPTLAQASGGAGPSASQPGLTQQGQIPGVPPSQTPGAVQQGTIPGLPPSQQPGQQPGASSGNAPAASPTIISPLPPTPQQSTPTPSLDNPTGAIQGPLGSTTRDGTTGAGSTTTTTPGGTTTTTTPTR
jgi:hypothetical protein